MAKFTWHRGLSSYHASKHLRIRSSSRGLQQSFCFACGSRIDFKNGSMMQVNNILFNSNSSPGLLCAKDQFIFHTLIMINKALISIYVAINIAKAIWKNKATETFYVFFNLNNFLRSSTNVTNIYVAKFTKYISIRFRFTCFRLHFVDFVKNIIKFNFIGNISYIKV